MAAASFLSGPGNVEVYTQGIEPMPRNSLGQVLELPLCAQTWRPSFIDLMGSMDLAMGV